MSRFDSIKFDEGSINASNQLKDSFKKLEAQIEIHLLPSKYTSLALTSLEEALVWLNKAIAEQQNKRLGDAAVQAERNEN